MIPAVSLPLPPPREVVTECQTLARYLTGMEPSAYILEKYHACSAGLQAMRGSSPTWFDNALMSLARRGSFGTALVDTYARWFAPRSLVRYKLTLLLAILENSPDSHVRVTAATTGDRWTLVRQLILVGLRETAALVVATIILGPLHACAALSRKPR